MQRAQRKQLQDKTGLRLKRVMRAKNDSQLLAFDCELNLQLLLKFIERMKLPRSLSIFFCSWKIA
jgi:hypothetical protein